MERDLTFKQLPSLSESLVALESGQSMKIQEVEDLPKEQILYRNAKID